MAVPRQNDRDLVLLARRGDPDAFSALVERHQRLVFGVAYAITGDRALAEDLGQETFVAAWRSFTTLHDDARVVPWLTGIARNLAHNARRTRARRKDPDVLADADAVDPAPTALERVIEEESELLLRATLAELAEQHREALVLYYLEGRSVSQVAASLGVGEGAVKQRLLRARESLRERLAERLEAKLEGMRPQRSFTPAVLAAITTADKAAGAGTAPTAGVVMTTKQMLIVGSVLIVVAGAATVLIKGGSRAQPRVAAPQATTRDDKAPAVGPAATPAERAAVDTPRARRIARAERERLLQAITARRKQRIATPSGPAAPSATPSEKTIDHESDDLDKEYVRDSVRAILPLIQECYVEALARIPDLEGEIMVNFTIEGEPDVGGLIGESEIDPDKTSIDDPEFLECMRETMFAIEIDPPTGGGTVHVSYPFSVHP